MKDLTTIHFLTVIRLSKAPQMQIIKMNRKSSKENQLSLVTLSLDLICL